jgi:lipoic acid synthetase
MWECFSEYTATFLIMGDRCTRNCRFCAVAHGPSGPPEDDEPAKVAAAVQALELRYVVITSVTRDDLPDGGAACFAATIQAVRTRCPDTLVEVLIPDLQGNAQALETILRARPNILNHNIETVPRLYPVVRPEADYKRSLQLLERARRISPAIPTKSGLMLGLGETADEISQTLADLHMTGCRILTLGQYLQPSKQHLPVKRFVPPEEFEHWREEARKIGFVEIASGPFVRSSYHAKELFQRLDALT